MAGENPYARYAPKTGGIAIIPQNPYAAPAEARAENADARAAAALGMDAQRLSIAQMQAQLARESEERAREKQERDNKTTDARGGVDTQEAERMAAFLGTQVADEIRTLRRIGNAGAPTLKDATIGSTLLGNYATDEDRQRTIRAQRNLLDAALTLGTGAAYTQEQIDAKRGAYFPQPGDKEETIRDANRRLEVLLASAKLKAGAAAPQIDEAMRLTEAGSSNPLSGDQQKLYDAYLASNPQATADQLRSFGQNAGLGSIDNADQIIQDRQRGLGVAPANSAINGAPPAAPDAPYSESVLSQGLSGVNEGIAGALGAPVDILNAGLGLGANGINALANTNLQVSDKPTLGSEWWKGIMGGAGAIAPEANHPFVRRVGQSVGSAIVPGLGTARTGGQVASALASGIGGGVGAATAQQVAPGNGLAEMAGELAGGGLTGLGAIANGRRLAQREIEAAVPTVPQLQEQAGGLYRQAEQNGVTASPQQTQDISDRIGTILRQEGSISPAGRVSEVHPKVREAYATAQDYAGASMNPTQMQTVRSILSDGRMSAEPKEARIARMLTNEFDNWTAPLAPELAQARDVSSRYLNAQTLEQARELAEARAGQFSNSGVENGIRTEYRKLDRQAIRGQQPGMSDPLVAQIEDVSRGTTGSNVARALGKFAPRGVVSASMATGVPFAIGNAAGGPVVGGALSAATLGVGEAGRRIATHLANRGANVAELIARNGGQLQQAPYLTPDIQRLIAAQLVAQSGQYLDDESPNGY